MDLIKKIKQAEAQAQEIIDKARADATEKAQKGHQSRQQALGEAEQARKKDIETAVAQADAQAVSEIEKLNAQGEKQRKQLRDKAADKMAKAVADVMDYLRG